MGNSTGSSDSQSNHICKTVEANSLAVGWQRRDASGMRALQGQFAPFTCNPMDISSISGKIFDGIKFIRLSAWKECIKTTVLAGGISCAGMIFRRFELKKDRHAVLEFWFRGAPLSEGGAKTFSKLLQNLGELSDSELERASEVWRTSLGERVLGGIQLAPSSMAQSAYRIDAAEVGELNGRRMLALWWKQTAHDRKFLSMFIDAQDGPGKIVHEIHFSAPAKDMHRYASDIVDTLRSFQWSRELPPPILSSSKRSA